MASAPASPAAERECQSLDPGRGARETSPTSDLGTLLEGQMRRTAILGGTGFIGRNLVCDLARQGHPTRVFTRRRERHRHLLVFPSCELVELDVHSSDALARGLAGCDAAVNLVGILNPRDCTFHDAHVALAENVVGACRKAGVAKLLHMSALRANGAGPSEYLRTKAEGEARVRRGAGAEVRVTSLRPSVVFGPGDSFFNRFATLLAMSPGLFPLACPESKFAPVYVGDVVEAIVRCLTAKSETDHRLELAGPRVYTLRRLVEYTAQTAGLRRRVTGLGDFLSRLQARVMERLPGPPFSFDNYLSLQVDSVLTGENGLRTLGIAPTEIERVVPTYIGRRNRAGRYQDFRTTAGRP